jgi:hypothetical protein
MSGTSETAIQQPSTEVGETFKISDLGTMDGGKAVSALRDAFEDSWEEKAIVVEDEYGNDQTYSFEGRAPIYCCHVPDDAYYPEEHGPQTMGFRYSYKFIRNIDEGNEIRVVDWEETRFPDVEEVVYP